MAFMNYSVTDESFTSLSSYWHDPEQVLNWSSIFILPGWLEVWWQTLGSGARLYLRTVRQGDSIIGIAPLQIKGKTASFIGSSDVCDYLDFVVATGKENDFFRVLLDDLRRQGISQLDLGLSKPDSAVLTALVPLSRGQGHDVSYRREDVSVELDLPGTWEEYLSALATKYRHEVERKLRRFSESGRGDYRSVEEAADSTVDTFLRLFTGRKEKAAFMTPRMESFFRSVAERMARDRLLRFGIINLDDQPVAMVMCFDYNCVYLYNSGYDPRYRAVSAGLVCKVLCIKDSIERGRRKFDFLKGGEAYKHQLGGREVPLYRCRINLR